MANPDHLELLCQGAKAWNAWRSENPHIAPDLSQATLSLTQRQFGPSSGGPIDLRAANLEGAMLRFATLTGADLEGARLTGADLMHARIDNAKLIAADLTDAQLDHADLAGADMTRAVLIGASFTNVRNLTQGQVNAAYGDASTLLPATLQLPTAWFPDAEDSEDYSDAPMADEVEEDLYELLGVPPSATGEDIRAAHRALVKKLHPDVNPNDRAAQEQFKKVSTAYHILSDAEKRAAYDNGEIDSQGRVRPEFEAQQEFRRYAFRFYAAAVLSVLLAGGALMFVWHAVLRSHGPSVTVATGSGSKQHERLGNGAELKSQVSKLNADASGGAREIMPEMEKVEPVAKPEPSGPPGGAETPPQISAKEESPARPLGEQHKDAEADRAQSSSARSRTPEGQTETSASASASSAEASRKASGNAGAAASIEQTSSQQSPGNREAGANPAGAIVPKAGGDDVTTLLRDRAMAKAKPKGEPQTTASVDPDTTDADTDTDTDTRPRAGATQQRHRAYREERRTRWHRWSRRAHYYDWEDSPREMRRLSRRERAERRARLRQRELYRQADENESASDFLVNGQ